jgi:HSP20 family protein
MQLIPRSNDFHLATLHDRMDRLLESFFDDPDMGSRLLGLPVDVYETPETVQVQAELPGIEPKDIHLSVVGDTLTIRGERIAEREEKGKTWHRRERRAGSFLRTIPLPARVDPDHVEATDRSGILTITLPKLEEAKARRIPVKAQ